MVSFHPVNRLAEYAGEGKELLEDYPLSTVIVAFGVGLAAGLALTAVVSECSESRNRTTTQRLGQHLLDAMSRVLPESVTRTLHA